MRSQVYGKRIPPETPVQLCLGDFLREGNCAFDVGANIGALSVAMSRMVGNSGQVHAFEPNARIVEKLRNNLEADRATNVEVVPKAAWKETGRRLPFYCDPSRYSAASSLSRRKGFAEEIQVNTVALDDYCKEHNLIPNSLKLDIEGAEFEALVGAKNLLTQWKPVLVLEYFPMPTPTNDALEFLDELGYIFYDVNLYRRVTRQFYRTFGNGPCLANVLAIPGASIGFSPYNHVEFQDQQDIAVEEGRLKTNPIHLLGPA